MKIIRIVAALILAYLPVCVTDDEVDPENPTKTIHGVYDLDSRNFDSSIRDGNVWLIEFYASWCGHCKRFEMEYQTVALALHGKNQREGRKKKRFAAKVDGDTEKAIMSRFDISGYPTFVLVDGWSVYEYDGERSRKDLVAFAEGGYKNQEPIPFLFSPMGPLGQFRALFMKVGDMFIDAFGWIKTEFGLSPIFTAVVLLGTFTVTSFIGMIIIAILLTPKAKDD